MLLSPARFDLDTQVRAVREMTEILSAGLSAEDQTAQSMPDASPTKWHRAHTTWFFETFVLSPLAPGYESCDPSYRFLFNSYYEAIGPRHARNERGLVTRPGVAGVAAYRRHVDDAMARLLSKDTRAEAAAGLVELGLHHEQQHQELLVMDAKHLLACNPCQPVYGTLPWRVPARARHGSGAGEPAWHERAGGLVEVGHDGDGFAYDNEGPRHTVHLEPFAVASSLVTCGEWSEFIADGGYRRPEVWMSDGWATVRQQGWESPDYWFEAE